MSKLFRMSFEKKADQLSDEMNDFIQQRPEKSKPPRDRPTSSALSSQLSAYANEHTRGISINFSAKLFHQKSVLKQLTKQITSIDLSDNELCDVSINGATTQSLTCSNKNHNKYLNANIKFLQSLILTKNSLVVFPRLVNMENLTCLNLSRNSISSFPNADNLVPLRNLTQLILASNNIEKLPPSIAFLSKLTELDVSSNKLLALPNEIYSLIKLEKLQLQDNLLTEISCSGLIKLENLVDGHKNGLNLRKNRLKVPPQDIAHKGILCIRDYVLNGGIDYNNDSLTKYLQTHIAFKLFVLGHDGAGKTELVRSLRQQFSKNPEEYYASENENSSQAPSSGNGNDSKAKQSQHNDEVDSVIDTSLIKVVETRMRRSLTGTVTSTDIHIDIWHFKGGESYHAMHEIFFSKHALFVITWKMQVLSSETENDVNQNIQYWIDLVQSRAPGAVIIIVGTHADLLRVEEIDQVLKVVNEQLETNALERIVYLEQRLSKVDERKSQRTIEEIIAERKMSKRLVIPVNAREDIRGILPLSDSVSGGSSKKHHNSGKNDPLSYFSSPVRLTSIDSSISSLSSESASDILMQYPLSGESTIGARSRESTFVGKSTPPAIPRALNRFTSSPSSSYQPTRSMLSLCDRILELATPTVNNCHPFGNFGHDARGYYSNIRAVINKIKESVDYCSVDAIRKQLAEDFTLASTPEEEDKNLKRLRHALSYFSNIGEVFWIEPPTLSNHAADKAFDISRLVFLRPRYLMDKVGSILQMSSWRDRITSNDGVVTWKDVLRVMNFDTEIMNLKSRNNSILSYGEQESVNTAVPPLFGLKESDVQILMNPEPISSAGDHHSENKDKAENQFSRPASNVSDSSEILLYLRGLLEYYGFIIPIRQTSQPSGPANPAEQPSVFAFLASDIQHVYLQQQHLQQPSTPTRNRSGSTASTNAATQSNKDELYRSYLMPLLLTNEADSSYYRLEESQSATGTAQTSFKRCFRFENYVVPRLLHKILAKVYASTLFYPSIVKKAISKNSFMLKFESFRVYIRMQTEGTVNILEIDSFGFIFFTNEMLEKMDILCEIVGAVLDDIPGLPPLVDLITFCPSCRSDVSKQSSQKTTIGEFKLLTLIELRRQLENCDLSSDIELRAWRSRHCVCPADPQCQVQPEQLIHIPSKTKAKLEEIQKSEHIFQHLLEDMVASSASFSNHLLVEEASRVDSDIDQSNVAQGSGFDVRKSVVKIASIKPSSLHTDPYFFFKETPNAINKLVLDNLKSNKQNVYFEIQDLNSGVLIEMTGTPTDSVLERRSIVLTSEHIITNATDCNSGKSYSPKFDYTTLFLVGDETHWHCVAKLVFQGSRHSLSDKKFWDICALELETAIKPVPISLNFDPSPSNIRRNTVLAQVCDSLLPPPLHPVQVASAYLSENPTGAVGVAENQVVCLMGYPQGQSLSIDWGRVEKCDSSEILVNVASDYGNSGGPLFNRNGEVVGILSRSFTRRKYSSIEPLSDILLQLRNKVR